MNNEFMIWFLKGYITQKKGEKVNWAKVVASTNWEKARRKEIKLIKSGSTYLFRKACGGEGSVEFDCKFYRFEQPSAIVGFDKEATIYPYGVSPTKFLRMTKVHVLLQNLLK
jgi:hypothetical protein